MTLFPLHREHDADNDVAPIRESRARRAFAHVYPSELTAHALCRAPNPSVCSSILGRMCRDARARTGDYIIIAIILTHHVASRRPGRIMYGYFVLISLRRRDSRYRAVTAYRFVDNWKSYRSMLYWRCELKPVWTSDAHKGKVAWWEARIVHICWKIHEMRRRHRAYAKFVCLVCARTQNTPSNLTRIFCRERETVSKFIRDNMRANVNS